MRLLAGERSKKLSGKMVHSSLSLSEHCPGAKFAFGREREREPGEEAVEC